MKKLKQYLSLSEYLRSLPDHQAPFVARLEGQVIKTCWGRIPCLYFEAAVVMFAEGRIAGHTDTFRSQGGIHLLAGDSRIKADGNFRLYLGPTWLEREPKEPELKALLDEAKARMEASDAALAEFALLPDRDYWANIVTEGYWLPPEGPDSPPRRARNLTLYLSDKPFVDGRPQGEATPMSHWTY